MRWRGAVSSPFVLSPVWYGSCRAPFVARGERMGAAGRPLVGASIAG
jgi:hypothetical protein